MKTTVTLLIALLITTVTSAQQGINYKAMLKDTNGNVLGGTFMNVQFSIHEITATGTIVYQEDHNYTTDINGMFIHNIGSEASPSVGVFSDIDWSANQHFLQTSITYSGGTVDFDATEFMAVPYAKHAKTAENVFSGDYNDLINQPTTIPTGLEKVTDSIDSGTGLPIYGWRLVGADPEKYGNIGKNAVDLSTSFIESGATGNYSIAMGIFTTASGWGSTAMGRNTNASKSRSTAMGGSTTASGYGSTAMGLTSTASGWGSTAMGNSTASGSFSTSMGIDTTAPSYAETVIGTWNTNYTQIDSIAWASNDRLFVIGNGTYNARSNALTVLKNGTITAPSLSTALINTAGNKALITKEYADTNYKPLAYGSVTGAATPGILGGTGNFTVTRNTTTNEYTISVTGEDLLNSNTVVNISINTTGFRSSTVTYSGGKAIVHIFASSFAKIASPFQFVMYKE